MLSSPCQFIIIGIIFVHLLSSSIVLYTSIIIIIIFLLYPFPFFHTEITLLTVIYQSLINDKSEKSLLNMMCEQCMGVVYIMG